MIISEIFVWIFAIVINIFALTLYPNSYQSTFLTSILQKIILNPYPYWSIIILSGIGTFLSIKFGDDIMDVVTHEKKISDPKNKFKNKIIIFASIFTLTIFAYYHLLESLQICLK